MNLTAITIRNFRRLENVSIELEPNETVFVGPNNSGKTSATAIFRCFLGGRDFKVYDFSATRMEDFEKFVLTGEPADLPKISLDLWFRVDPESIAFGRAYALLPSLSGFTQLGLRLEFGIADAKGLLDSYTEAHPIVDGARSKSLFQFLATDNMLSRYSTTTYASLEKRRLGDGTCDIAANPLDSDEGRPLLRSLLRVEFIDAQRNINDDDNSRSNRLSSAFSAFYRKNLEQADQAADAYSVIDDNNNALTEHYGTQFASLFELIAGLGVPSANDRDLRIVSSLSPETALRGNTELLYIDRSRNHELPEQYNGLGFKNLIYMAIQARHFHSQWLRTEESRPLCLLLFIEEPEVHLHAQVQQTFIANIWSVIHKSATDTGEPRMMPQLVVTTHSSHILDAVDFEKVRYFQRAHSNPNGVREGIRELSMVRSLRTFQRQRADADSAVPDPAGRELAFLKRYLRLTHCDLFFADGAILVEGAAEKLLMPTMIEKSANRLRGSYLTVLEVGGAYAHRFEGLLEYLNIPYLVITDLDSVEPTGNGKACRADTAGALTSNASLKALCRKEAVSSLHSMTRAEKINEGKDRCVAFQIRAEVIEGEAVVPMWPRTFEEAIVYENFALLRSNEITLGIVIPTELDEAYNLIYERIQSGNFKKTDFAMSLLAGAANWHVPRYISEGLEWLELRLTGPVSSGSVATTEPANSSIAEA